MAVIDFFSKKLELKAFHGQNIFFGFKGKDMEEWHTDSSLLSSLLGTAFWHD